LAEPVDYFHLGTEKKVLVVDDEPDTLDMLQSLLQRWGYNVATAGNGVEALMRTMESAPDLLLTDLSMPQMDGVELCRRYKAQRDLRAIPVLVVTGLPDLPIPLQGIVDAFFPKPLDCYRLLSALEFYLPGD
jgi:CheY-like chemotaxis protein